MSVSKLFTSIFKSQPRRGLFFDNLERNINDVNDYCKQWIKSILIYNIKVDDKYTENAGLKPYDEKINTNKYDIKYMNNKYAYVLTFYNMNDKSYVGLNDSNINYINNWIQESSQLEKRFVIFDWDGTLSVVESMVGILETNKHIEKFKSILSNKNIKNEDLINIYAEHALIYFMGGRTRMNNIKTVIEKLFDNGIQVYILTSNETAINDKFFFMTLLKQLDQRFQEKHLLCTRESNQVIKKSDMILKTPELNNQSGGKKRRNTKRNNKKRRNTKKINKS